MIFRYLLARMAWAFVLFFICLLIILGSGDLLIRLTVLPSIEAIPTIFLLMLPLMAVMAIPMAASFAVQGVVGCLYDANEMIMVMYLPRVRRKLFYAVGVFSLVLMLVYVPLVWQWAPHTYLKGKEELIGFAKDRLTQLEAGTFHSFFSRASIFFKRKQRVATDTFSSDTVFEHIMLMFRDSHNEQHLVIAKKARLSEQELYLWDGTMQTMHEKKQYVVRFDQTTINIDRLLHGSVVGEKDKLLLSDTRFLTWRDMAGRLGDYKVLTECNVRMSRILWLALLPLISLLCMFVWGVFESNNLMFVLLVTSFFSLFSYVMLGLGRMIRSSLLVSSLMLYAPPVIILGIVYALYKRRWKE